MANIVPADDLPANLVPADDLPDSIRQSAPRMQNASSLPVEPSAMSRLGQAGMKGFMAGGPGTAVLGMAGEGMKMGGEALDSASYKAGGLATDVAAKVLPPEAAAGVGLAANVGIQSIPMFLGGSAASKVATPLMEAGAKQLMASSLKAPKGALETGKATRAIQTMLDEGINVTPGGVAKLRAEINRLNAEIADAIANSPATIDKAKVAANLGPTFTKFSKQVTPQSDLSTIRGTFNDFIENPLLPKRVPEQVVSSKILDESGRPFTKTIPASGTNEIPVQLAQELKQGTYRALGNKAYGELKGADVEAQKALARGLKEEIASKVPGIDKLNAKESELLNAETLAVSRVLMDSNKNPLGLGWLAANPAAWIGFAVDRSPIIKSLIARATYSGAKPIPTALGRLAGAGAGAAYLGGEPSGGTLEQLYRQQQQ